MPKPRFSIAVMLLFVAVVVLSLTVFVEHQRYVALEQHSNVIKRELGHIVVDDPTKIHLRALRCEAQNTWQYRLYVPKDARYVMEFYHNTGTRSVFGDWDPIAPDPGQHTITIQVAEDLLSPGDVSAQCFMVSFEDRRAGVSFYRSSLRSFANNLGNYKNAAHRLDHFLSHNSSVDTFSPGEVIPLLHIKNHAKPPQLIDGKPAEIVMRLVPNAKEPQSTQQRQSGRRGP